MSFSKTTRDEALVRAARHCCVCHRYNAVGVEVHHIVPEASGGTNSSDNAIALCFDCHAAAGHYNPNHPRGTKFSPDELRKHRDRWHELVASGVIKPNNAGEIAGCYGRHLVCLDYDAIKDLFEGNKERLPFDVTFIEANDVLEMMRRILADDLPYAWATSRSIGGYFWSTNYDSAEEFHSKNPEFDGRTSRPLVDADFAAESGIPSKVLRGCYREGLPLAEIGTAEFEEFGCGTGVNMYYSVRRPLFVFSELQNRSDKPLSVVGILSKRYSTKKLEPRLKAVEGESKVRKITPITLLPGQNLLVPCGVVLGPHSSDDLSTDFEIEKSLTSEQGQIVGYRCAAEVQQAYIWIGPSESIAGYSVDQGIHSAIIPIHEFDLTKIYIWYRAWYVGSCPHVFASTLEGKWVYLGEILQGAWHRPDTSKINLNKQFSMIRIVETDFESTVLNFIKIDNQIVASDQLLLRGQFIDLPVVDGTYLEISGWYDAAISTPNCPTHFRQKTSLLKNYKLKLTTSVQVRSSQNA
jgi:hypothetical protein